MDTVIVEGPAETERNPSKLKSLKAEYSRKYDYTPDWADEKRQVVFRVTSKIAHAWKAPRMHRSLVKFVF